MAPHDARFDFQLGTEPDAVATPRRSDGVFRIALLGDFSGRGRRGADPGGGTRGRRPIPVDRDEVDTAIAALAPEVRLVLDPDSAPVVIRFRELEDFHPDRLSARLAIFHGLRELRDEVAARDRRAVRQPVPRAEEAAGTLAQGSLLDMILDEQTPAPAADPRRAKGAVSDELGDYVRQAVTPHVVPQRAASDEELIAKIDAVIDATMRALLHHPDFQALEALRRGVDQLVRGVETGERLKISLIDCTSDDIASALDSDAGWSLAVVNESFGPDDLERLAQLASRARAAGVPVIANALPTLAGATSFAGLSDPDDWDHTPPAEWELMRRSPAAAYVALAAPRVLMRVPYGTASDSCTFAPFEEMGSDEAAHDAYLWGSGAMACAAIIVRGIEDGDAPATHGSLDHLPLHVATVDGEAQTVPCAEGLLTQRAESLMLDRGLTPLLSMRDGDRVMAPRIQALATPPRALPFGAGAHR